MFQFRALSQNADEIPISTYLGTWNIDVQWTDKLTFVFIQ
jgi:hypothetical protein